MRRLCNCYEKHSEVIKLKLVLVTNIKIYYLSDLTRILKMVMIEAYKALCLN